MCSINVSVIIPLHNEPRIRHTIEALLRQTYPHDRYEILVVENSSQDNSMEIVSGYSRMYPERVKLLLDHQRRGSYAARNAGISAAKGKILAFTDADCIPAPDWIEAGVHRLGNIPDPGLVGGYIELFAYDPLHVKLVEQYDLVFAFNQKKNIEQDHYGVTANIFTYREMFNKIGLFDPMLSSGGDFEWAQRIYRAGYTQLYAEDVVVRHPCRYTISQLVQKVIRTTSGGYDLTIRYGLKRQGIVYLAKWLVLPPYKKIRKILIHPQLSIRIRLKLILLRMILHYIHLWTVFRLRMGRQLQ